jgi:hypothetical protein
MKEHTKKRKKKVKKLSNRVKWERFKNRYPRIFKIIALFFSGIIVSIILLKIFFFNK